MSWLDFTRAISARPPVGLEAPDALLGSIIVSFVTGRVLQLDAEARATTSWIPGRTPGPVRKE